MKKLLLFTPLFLALFFSCKKDETKIDVVIEGIVINSETTQPEADATIELITRSSTHSVTTDETGYFNLGEYTIGDYTIIISKDGFVTQSQKINATEILSSGASGYEVVKQVVCNLVPANEKAELTIYRKYEDGEVMAASNFPYVITTGDINSTIEGVTDNNGRISLNNMPQIFTISIDHELNGIRYKTLSEIDLRKESYLILYGYYTEASLGIVSANILDSDGKPVQDFAVDGKITLQFTAPVDSTSKVSLLERAWLSTDVQYEWSNNNMKLDITPFSDLKVGTLYSLDLELKSTSGMQSYNNTIDFTTAN